MNDSEFEQKIKTMLEDTTKGLATKDELKTCVSDAVAEKLAGDEYKYLKEAESQVNELKEANTSLESQVKRLMSSRFSAIKTSDGRYNGIWGNLEQAKNFGLYVIAHLLKNENAQKELSDLGIEDRFLTKEGKITKTVTGTTITGGSALIPTEFIPQLIVLMEAYGVFRRNAQEWPMASDSSVAAAQTSDVVVYSPGAGTEPTESSPGFKNIGLNARKMMTLTAIDSEVSEDLAIAVGEVVARSIIRAFSKMEDLCGFIGDGTSTYFGFVGMVNAILGVDSTPSNIMALHVQAAAGAWPAITRADILALPGIILNEADEQDCKWYCNRNFYYTVMINLALALGGAKAQEVIMTGYTRNPLFEGRPVEFANALPRVKAAADHIPLLMGNLKLASMFGDRRALQIDQSKEAYFKTDQLGIRGTERIAINNHGVGTAKDVGASLCQPGAVVALLADIA